MEWVNRSTPTSSIRLDACVGLIVNRTHRKLLGLITGHHWFALRRVSCQVAAESLASCNAHLSLPSMHTRYSSRHPVVPGSGIWTADYLLQRCEAGRAAVVCMRCA